MTSVQERLKTKQRESRDTWSTREQLCLASSVLKSGDQNWISVSRSLKPFAEKEALRPPDWFSHKSCANQYTRLLENVDTPKRKKRESGETIRESIVKRLTQERTAELGQILAFQRDEYQQLKSEVNLLKSGSISDDKLQKMWLAIEQEEREQEQKAKAHSLWLTQRQQKQELPSQLPTTPLKRTLDLNDSQEESVDDEEKKRTPSTLLTNLLKAPSPTKQIQNATSTAQVTSPTIASLLNSSAGVHMVSSAPQTVTAPIHQIVTSVIPSGTPERPSAGAPTLSMLLALPANLPKGSLPTLPANKSETETTVRSATPKTPAIQVSNTEEIAGTDVGEIIEQIDDVIGKDKLPDVIDKDEINEIMEDIEELIKEEITKSPQTEPNPVVIETFPVTEKEERVEVKADKPISLADSPESEMAIEEIDHSSSNIAEIIGTAIESSKEEKEECGEEKVEDLEKEEEKVVEEESKSEDKMAVDEETVEEKSEEVVEKKFGDKEQVKEEDKDMNVEEEPKEIEKIEEVNEVKDEVVKVEEKEEKEESKDENSEVEKEEVKEEKVEEVKQDEKVEVDEEKGDKESEVEEKSEEKIEDKAEVEEIKEEVEEVKKDDEKIDELEVENKEEEVNEVEDKVEKKEEMEVKVEKKEEKVEAEETFPEKIEDEKVEADDKIEDEVKPEAEESKEEIVEKVEETKEEVVEKEETVEKEEIVEVKDDKEKVEKMEKEEEIESKETEEVEVKKEEPVSLPETQEVEEESSLIKLSAGRAMKTYSKKQNADRDCEGDNVGEEGDYRNWKKAVLLVYHHFTQHKCASLFLRPITDDQAPGYHSVVFRPMDLSTIKKNIENGTIRSTMQFQRDVMLMFQNALMYNASDTEVYRQAVSMQEDCLQELQMLVGVTKDVSFRRETRTAGNSHSEFNESNILKRKRSHITPSPHDSESPRLKKRRKSEND